MTILKNEKLKKEWIRAVLAEYEKIYKPLIGLGPIVESWFISGEPKPYELTIIYNGGLNCPAWAADLAGDLLAIIYPDSYKPSTYIPGTTKPND